MKPKAYDDESEGADPVRGRLQRSAVIAGAFALVGGALVYKDYISGKISGANEQRSSEVTPATQATTASQEAADTYKQWQERMRIQEKSRSYEPETSVR